MKMTRRTFLKIMSAAMAAPISISSFAEAEQAVAQLASSNTNAAVLVRATHDFNAIIRALYELYTDSLKECESIQFVCAKLNSAVHYYLRQKVYSRSISDFTSNCSVVQCDIVLAVTLNSPYFYDSKLHLEFYSSMESEPGDVVSPEVPLKSVVHVVNSIDRGNEIVSNSTGMCVVYVTSKRVTPVECESLKQSICESIVNLNEAYVTKRCHIGVEDRPMAGRSFGDLGLGFVDCANISTNSLYMTAAEVDLIYDNNFNPLRFLPGMGIYKYGTFGWFNGAPFTGLCLNSFLSRNVLI